MAVLLFNLKLISLSREHIQHHPKSHRINQGLSCCSHQGQKTQARCLLASDFTFIHHLCSRKDTSNRVKGSHLLWVSSLRGWLEPKSSRLTHLSHTIYKGPAAISNDFANSGLIQDVSQFNSCHYLSASCVFCLLKRRTLCRCEHLKCEEHIYIANDNGIF